MEYDGSPIMTCGVVEPARSARQASSRCSFWRRSNSSPTAPAVGMARSARSPLVQFDEVARRVGHERLAVGTVADGHRVAYLHATRSQLGHGGVEVLDQQREVLAQPVGDRRLDEVELLATVTRVEPGAPEAEGGSVGAQR